MLVCFLTTATRDGILHRFQLHDHAGEALRERVVNVSGHPMSFFHNKGFLMNGCAGSAAAKFVPCAAARRTSESFASSSNHRITLCAFKRRPIVLSICPRNLSGAGAVAKTSKL